MYADAQISVNKFKDEFKKINTIYVRDLNIPMGLALVNAFVGPYGFSEDSSRALTHVLRGIGGEKVLTSVERKNERIKNDPNAKKRTQYYQNHYARIGNPINFLEGVAAGLGVSVAGVCDRLTQKRAGKANVESNLAGKVLKGIFVTPFQVARYALKLVNLPINLALDQIDRGVRALVTLDEKKGDVKGESIRQEKKALLDEDSPENTDELESNNEKSKCPTVERSSEKPSPWKSNPIFDSKGTVPSRLRSSGLEMEKLFRESKNQNNSIKSDSNDTVPKPSPAFTGKT